MKKFDLTNADDRRAFHEEALALAHKMDLPYTRATQMLGDRVSLGPKRKSFDLSDPANRAAIATEAQGRIAQFREEALRMGDSTTTLTFSDALAGVLADAQAGKEIPGLKAEAES